MTEPRFSVVVNTYNRAGTLRSTLEALRGLRGPVFEVVVVNGPSTDDTSSVLDGWAGKIRVRSCPEANLARSRNIGIAAAAGDIVAFIDDDAVPDPNWLAELAVAYRDPRVGAAGGFTVDNTGERLQAGKTLCDRFGNAFAVPPFFDERELCFAGSPYFPSLLGTNSSFRRDVLLAVGGFDHAFAYFLDETDVCLRVVDAGLRVQYVPDALVYHQFAASHLRDTRRVPTTLYPSAVSKSYFAFRHGAGTAVGRVSSELESYRAELRRANRWLEDHGEISPAHRASLDQDVAWGIEEGRRRYGATGARLGGDLPAEAVAEDAAAESLLPFGGGSGRRFALVSRHFPPAGDAGIARWTSLMAEGLAARGHAVHVVAHTDGSRSVRFERGFWIHRVPDDHDGGELLCAQSDLPPNIASWAAAARTEVLRLSRLGLDAVSFPIWDLEGVALLGEGGLGVVMSLHTTYAMARPHKPEWQARPIYDALMVRRMIAREREALERAPVILANSRSIIADLEAAYGVALGERCVLARHGTPDPFARDPDREELRRRAGGAPFRVVFAGRFELRKGYDIAARAVLELLEATHDAEAVFAGDEPTDDVRRTLAAVGAEKLLQHPRVRVLGHLSRAALDNLYASAAAVLMPSRYESFGLVAIEAMAAGAPVVALRTGGLAEVVEDGKTGFLADPEPFASAWQGCARALLRLAADRATCAAMGRAARAEFERRFTMEMMVAEAETAFVRAAQRAGRIAAR